MYNRYIPNGMAYTRVLEEDAPSFLQQAQSAPPPQARTQHQKPSHGQPDAQWSPPKDESPRSYQTGPAQPPEPPAGGKKDSFLSGLLKSFHLEDLDTGDILLLLILIFLVLDGDGDNLELILTLGLVILFSLSGKKDTEAQEPD